MTEKIHIIPVGFDFERLYLPITRGELEADRAILLATDDDPDLVEHSVGRLTRELSAHDVEIEKQTISLYNFSHIYQSAYDLLNHLLDEDESKVFINISSMPRTVGFGLAGAAYDLILEKNQNRNRIHVYYSAPEEYLAPRLVDTLEDNHSLFRILDRYFGREITEKNKKIGEVIDTAQSEIKDISEDTSTFTEIENPRSAWSEVEDLSQDQFTQAEMENVSEFADAVSVFSDKQAIESAEDILSQVKMTSENVEELEKLHSVASLLKSIHETETGPFSETLDLLVQVRDEINHRDYERRDIQDRLANQQSETDKLLRDVDRYGLTAGARQLKEKQRHLEFPAPLPPTERPAEEAILYVLQQHPTVESRSQLATLLTNEIVDQLEQRPREIVQQASHQRNYHTISRELSDRDLPEKQEKEIRQLLRDQLPEAAVENIADDISKAINPEKLENKINSRIQYNVSSLTKKGYIRQESRGRKTATILTDAGLLWTDTHDMDQKFIQGLFSLIAKELLPPFLDALIKWYESEASLSAFE